MQLDIHVNMTRSYVLVGVFRFGITNYAGMTQSNKMMKLKTEHTRNQRCILDLKYIQLNICISES